MDTRELLILLFVVHLPPLLMAAPSSSGRSSSDGESLSRIAEELESVVVRLKDFSRRFQDVSSNAGDSDTGRGGKLSGIGDLMKAELGDKKFSPSETSSIEEEVSLKDAIEYLVALAKHRKQERRDHDIPFP